MRENGADRMRRRPRKGKQRRCGEAVRESHTKRRSIGEGLQTERGRDNDEGESSSTVTLSAEG